MTDRANYRRCIVFLAVVCTLMVTGAAAAQGAIVQSTYSGAAGTLSYELYVPSTYVAGTPVPLIVALHGCTQKADKLRELTRFDQLAEAKNLIVVFPEQSPAANRFTCWNWFQGDHMKRGAGEPALIAGITQQVRDQYSIDSHRIYASGLSAGGAMAVVMSVTYPDVFAASGIASGCEYGAGAACAGYQGADPEQAGRQAYDAMGSYARAMPVIIFQGDKDTIVPPANAEQLVKQWQVTNDLVDDGARNRSVPAWPSRTTTATVPASADVPAGHSYRVAHYSDAHGQELLQYWLVSGMGHAWSGGCSCADFADPAGPDATVAMYDFFMSHSAP
jgi:poly(hydroxyalkanoate) depolymerase family esterase